MRFTAAVCQTFFSSALLLENITHATRAYPDCIEAPFLVNGGSGVQLTVSNFIEDGAVAEGCHGGNCDKTSVFRVSSALACAKVCSKLPDCDWWSVSVSFESEHLNRTLCHVVNTSGAANVSGTRPTNSSSGHRSCAPTVWPSCILQNSFVSPSGYSELWINATSLLGLAQRGSGCHDDDCEFTDRFKTPSIHGCTMICSHLQECRYWSVTTEEDDSHICWLRRGKYKFAELQGSISGDAECASWAPHPES